MPDFVIKNVYAPGDFSTAGGNIAPPDEQGARAQGDPPFNIELDASAAPFSIVLTDADTLFHETTGTDPLQELAEDVTIDGVLYTAGSHVVLNYVLSTDGGFLGYSITIGSSNGGSNTTTAFITPEPLVPGQQYIFTSEGNIGNNNAVPYANFVCFTAGSVIRTPGGLRAVETLRAGDLVITQDRGAQPVRWIGQRTVLGFGAFAPIEITARTLGAERTTYVSPQHRMLVSGYGPELACGASEVLVAAKHLVDGTHVRRCPMGRITYVHIALDMHDLVCVDGVWSETLFLSEQSRAALSHDQLSQIDDVLAHDARRADPRLACTAMELCRPAASRHEVQVALAFCPDMLRPDQRSNDPTTVAQPCAA